MGTLFVHGGIGSWFVVLFGLICLVTAALFAWRPDEGRLAVLRAMSLATGLQHARRLRRRCGQVHGRVLPASPREA